MATLMYGFERPGVPTVPFIHDEASLHTITHFFTDTDVWYELDGYGVWVQAYPVPESDPAFRWDEQEQCWWLEDICTDPHAFDPPVYRAA